MHIATFTGSHEDMYEAVGEAQELAQTTLDSLGPSELVSIQAQSFIDRHDNGTFAGNHTCFHIITIVYE